MINENLKYYVTVYECRSIQAASKLLFISPQGISQGLQRLEKKLDSRLFIRSRDGIVPTELGEALYDQAKKVIEEAAKLKKITDEYKKDAKKQLNIGVIGETKFHNALIRTIELFNDKRPGQIIGNVVSFESSKKLYHALDSKNIDIAFCYHSSRLDGYKYHRIIKSSNLGIMTSVEGLLGDKNNITWEDLDNIPIVMANKVDPYTDFIIDELINRNLTPNVPMYSTEPPFIIKNILKKRCVSFYRSEYKQNFLILNNKLKYIELSPPFHFEVSLVERAYGKACDAEFIAFLIQYFQENVL